jgi:hypothetical protein
MSIRLVAALALAAVTWLSAAQTTAPNTLTAAERQQGWKLLFDGKTLTGWRGYDPQMDLTKSWSVTVGWLKNAKNNGRPGSGGGDIVTVDQFTDFDLRFDWRISLGGNSGVKYLVLERLDARGAPMYVGDDGRSAIGHEYQLIDDLHHPDALIGPIRQTASFYDVLPPSAPTHVKPVGESNESRILVQGKHVEHWLNGERVLAYELESPAIGAAIAKSKFKNVTTFASRAQTRILLQDHGDEVWFRNLRILPLPSGAM